VLAVWSPGKERMDAALIALITTSLALYSGGYGPEIGLNLGCWL